MRCRILSLLLGVSLALVQSGAWAKHVCKYDSVRTTAPASRFTDNGDGTVTDAATGLQWKRCSEGQTWNGITCTGSVTVHTWRQALQLADGASYAGSDDWRLPNIKDLTSIVEQACYGPAIDWKSSQARRLARCPTFHSPFSGPLLPPRATPNAR